MITYHDFAGVDGSVESDFQLNQAEVPFRNTPKWLTNVPEDITTKDDIVDITQGLKPLGFMPPNIIIHNNEERQLILQMLLAIPVKNYEGVAEEQKIKAWGLPFVDSPTGLVYAI